MRTLLERLKPKALEMIMIASEDYPVTIKNIKKELSEKYFTGELKVDTAYDICLHNDIMFGLVELANCFESE
jgi:hypothetical protein